AGLFALQEQHLLTREAFVQILQRLDEGGWFSVSAWMDYPPRAPLRLAATIAEALEATGRSPERHLVAVRSWGALTYAVKKSPLSDADIAAVRDFASSLNFDPAILPGLSQSEREQFNRLGDSDFFTLLDRLISAQRDELYSTYPFRLRPATDDRPFFSQQLRWSSLPELTRLFGRQGVPFLELGYLVVLLTFALTAIAAVVLILMPLLRLGWRRGARLPVLFYFGGLGVGYMLFEMVLIHRFVLFLGHPVYAAAAVISTLLIFSGIGSRLSSRFGEKRHAPQAMAALVASAIGLYALILPKLLAGAIALTLPAKAAITVAVLAPPSLAMGFPFPLGLQRLGRASEADVPWAWGINGCLSVVSTALATIIAVEAGFTAVVLIAAGAYLASAAAKLPG
nr:spermidine synthase-like protein [Desulfuromonadales bacterium]NIR33645.1 spermidine synthase-like protein [Desulfuromonadales bacterium]NIS43932.1 spermidine synthase-like protein [Desulfuromonadales bacterium]